MGSREDLTGPHCTPKCRHQEYGEPHTTQAGPETRRLLAALTLGRLLPTTPKLTPTAPGGDGGETEPAACPWCGGVASVQPWHGGGPDKHLVGCADDGGDCPAAPSVTGETRAKAIAAWNTRRSPSTQDTRRAALEEAIAIAEKADRDCATIEWIVERIRALMEKSP